MRVRHPRSSSLAVCLVTLATVNVMADEFDASIRPLLDAHCVRCHSGNDPSGEVNFESILTPQEIDDHYQTWAKAVNLLQFGKMPPEGEPQPSGKQRELFRNWYDSRFVKNVSARPAPFRPRRLSNTEYRNTLRSLFGFDLEIAVIEAEQTRTEKSLVLKLLQTDPPGKSGFRNDTNSSPLTTNLWDQYAFLTDRALEEFFSENRLRDGSTFGFPQAEQLVREFIPRAWRRPVPAERFARILENIRTSEDLLSATKMELKVVLMSAEFLYRGLLFDGAQGQHAVDDYELAERLSYFIWADMPDAELFELAAAGTLSQPEVLKTQVQRMLDSPKSITLAEDFAVQWLALDDIDRVSDETPYVIALKSQPIDFVDYLFRQDRPLIEIIASKSTFANSFTKKFYGEDGKRLKTPPKPKGIEVAATPNQFLVLEQTPERGGLLTMPGILAMNRGPILRGTWILERILGEHLPDPPANVGQVAENRAGEQLTFRQRFEQHRSQKTCALCHDKIDPLGFALQGYDDQGGYLLSSSYVPPKKKRGSLAAETAPSLDTSGKLPSGEEFNDFQELQQILIGTQREPVIRNIVDRLLSYALCRNLEITDRPTVDDIVAKMTDHDGTYRELVWEIANSLPFRETILTDQQRQ